MKLKQPEIYTGCMSRIYPRPMFERLLVEAGLRNLTEATAPKNTGRTSKYKAAIKNRLKGGTDAPADAEVASTGETAPEGKETPRNIGNGRKHRAAISTHLSQNFKGKEKAPEIDPNAKPYDDVEIPEEAESDTEITGQDDDSVADAEIEKQLEREEEKEVETPVGNQSRLLTIDKTKINKELKTMCMSTAPHVPINKIKEVLAKFDIKLIGDDGREFDGKLIGVDGNTDVELAYKNGKRISNSAMVLFWHQIERTDEFEFHAYLS